MTSPSFQQEFETALSHQRQGRLSEAEQGLRDLCEHHPDRPEPLHALAQLFLHSGRPAMAADCLDTLSRLLPDNIALHDDVAALYERTGRPGRAAACYQRYHARHPNHANTCFNLARMLRLNRQYADALAMYDKALKAGIGGAEEVHLNKAVILADDVRRDDDARQELMKALELNPAYVPALLNFGNLEEESGNRENARALYERVLTAEPGNALALARLANVCDLKDANDPLIKRLHGALKQGGTNAEHRAGAGFALGKLYDRIGDYDAAFKAYADANAIWKAAMPPYSRAAQEKLTNDIVATFTKDWFEGFEPVSDHAPVFICGMFRSGSTLTEQILGAHEAITPGGELDFFPNLIRTDFAPFPAKLAAADRSRFANLAKAYLQELDERFPAARLVTDKRPDNFLILGLIKSLFPNAKVIHTRRNALDNCLSVYFLQFGPMMAYANDLLDIGHYWHEQERLMAHWKALFPGDVMDISYDAVVADPRGAVEPILNWLGLEWSDSCLDFHTLGNVVKTASYWQVREPLYTRSSGRAQHYSKHLSALKAYLADPT